MFETLLTPFNWISRFFVPKPVELSESAERCNNFSASQADKPAPSAKSFHYKRSNRLQEILSTLHAKENTSIPEDVEEKFCEMFKQIQEPFEIVKAQVSPSTSFLSYNYVLYKFCELLELDEYKKHFSLLNDIEQLRVQDKMWKGICEILNWKYISTNVQKCSDSNTKPLRVSKEKDVFCPT